MPACSLAPADRRAQVRRVGNDLDFACWSHAVFNSHADFDAHARFDWQLFDRLDMQAELTRKIRSPGDHSRQ